jgi:cytochrome c biogenesis protein CcmG/thiol:disulfide interchange protein DsbE
MRRFFIPGLVVAAAVALLALLSFGVLLQGPNNSIDSALARGLHPVPPHARTNLPVLGSPKSESLADLRGKVVVVNVFAAWCVACRAEAVILDREQQMLTKHGGTVLGVTYKDNTDDAAAFVRQEHISYPVVRDVSGSYMDSWGVDGIPETFVINRQGRIAALRRYQLAGNWLEDAVAPLLSSGA